MVESTTVGLNAFVSQRVIGRLAANSAPLMSRGSSSGDDLVFDEVEADQRRSILRIIEVTRYGVTDHSSEILEGFTLGEKSSNLGPVLHNRPRAILRQQK